MKEFVSKHKRICIIVGVILALILMLLIYGLVMSGMNGGIRAKYVWNGKEQYMGELGKDTPLNAKAYLTEDGNLRLDLYGQGADFYLDCKDSIFIQKTYIDFDRMNEEENYDSSLLISYREALYQAQSEVVTEADGEENMNSESEDFAEDTSNIVVPLINEEDANEVKEVSYEASKDTKYFAQMSNDAFGISLPYQIAFSLMAPTYGVAYEMDVVIDQLGNINVVSLGDKAIPVNFDKVTNYNKVSEAYPEFLLPEGIVIEEAFDDYTVDDNGEFDFEAMAYNGKDTKRDQYIHIIMTDLSNKEKLVGYLSQFTTKTSVDIHGVPIDIYADDAGKVEQAVYCDSKNVYSIYGYKAGVIKEALADFIPAPAEKK